MADASGAKPNDAAARLVKDPDAVPDLMLLRGIMGKTRKEGHQRIYMDAALSTWVDVPESDILHTEPGPKDGPLDVTWVWVNRNAKMVTGSARAAGGAGAGSPGGGANPAEGRVQAMAGIGGGGLATSQLGGCLTTIWDCQPGNWGGLETLAPQFCPTSWAICPPPTPLCHTVFPPTCPTRDPEICRTSVAHPCPVSPLPVHCPPGFTHYPPQCPAPTPLHGCVTPICPPHVTTPAVCQVHTAPIICQPHVTTPAVCQVHTAPIICQPHVTLQPICHPFTLPQNCPVQTPACPTGVACGGHNTLACPYPGGGGFGG